jgi:hypothetical protein
MRQVDADGFDPVLDAVERATDQGPGREVSPDCVVNRGRPATYDAGRSIPLFRLFTCWRDLSVGRLDAVPNAELMRDSSVKQQNSRNCSDQLSRRHGLSVDLIELDAGIEGVAINACASWYRAYPAAEAGQNSATALGFELMKKLPFLNQFT